MKFCFTCQAYSFQFPPCSMFQLGIQGSIFSYPFGRVTIVLGPLSGDTRSSHGISVEDETVTPKIDTRARTPISHPQSYELEISSMKRCGVDFYCGQSFPTSITGVINTSAARAPALTPSHPWSLYILPLIQQGCSENVWRTAQSFLLTQPKGVSVVCCWASGRNFTLCGASSVHSYLELVPLGQWWCTMPTQLAHPYTGECPLQKWWEKVCFGWGLMSILSASSAQSMKGFHWGASLFIWFLLPPVLLFPFPLVGISFS